MDREDMNETVIDGWGDASAVMARLSGLWLLDRVIEGQGRMQGLAMFTPLDAMSLAYREQGRAMFHNSVTEGVKEVSWSGNLPDDYYEEFVVAVYLTDDLQPGRTLYFSVVQECENGVHRWIEIPADGKSAGDYKEPASFMSTRPS